MSNYTPSEEAKLAVADARRKEAMETRSTPDFIGDLAITRDLTAAIPIEREHWEAELREKIQSAVDALGGWEQDPDADDGGIGELFGLIERLRMTLAAALPTK